MKKVMNCQIFGCKSIVEYDDSDVRPYIFHVVGNIIHCAGSNPNIKQYPIIYHKPTPQQARDHLLKEYFNYGGKIE